MLASFSPPLFIPISRIPHDNAVPVALEFLVSTKLSNCNGRASCHWAFSLANCVHTPTFQPIVQPSVHYLSSMDPETLVSFAFRAPKEVRTVELLGSWDNFQRPYAMYHDRRRGQGFHTGCFQFQDIVFDGSEVDWTKPRTGGLKQGGTYWYYFRLDDGVEAYDDLRECTASCPLMPGQVVNVIHVPREIPDSPIMKRSASVSLVGTLSQLSSLHTTNPQARFEAPKPPPVSKVHERCISDLALNGRLEGQPPTPPKEGSPSPPSSGDGLLKTGRRMFGSVGSLHKRGMFLTGSLRNMAGRAAMRARVRQESTTYEASLVDEGESIHPPRSTQNEAARPPTRRAVADIVIPETDFKSFSQVVAISTPAASPTKYTHDCDTASIGPRSIRDIQFLSTTQQQQEPQPRLYSLHNPDQHVSTIEPQPEIQTLDQPSPALAVASPTFSDATVSTTDGGDLGTPSLSDALAAPHVDVCDEHIAARLRWGSNQQNYRLPRDSVWLDPMAKPTTNDVAGEATGRSTVDAIFSELGYLGDAIR